MTPEDPTPTPAGISGADPAITGARSGQARAGASRSAYTLAAAPPPVLTTIAPTSATIGGATFTLTATGSNFDTGAVLLWNGAPLPTTRVSSTSLTAPVTPPASGTGSTVAVVVRNGSGVPSASKPFTLLAAAPPVLTTIAPSSATIGDPAFTLTATGSNFDTGAVILWDGVALPTTRVSSSSLTTLITVPATGSGATSSVVVRNGTAAVSAAQTFTILAPPAPVLTAIAPSSATLGDPAFTLTATGSTFDAGAVIVWNGTALPTTRISATQLTAPVDLAGATAGPVPVLVQNATLAQSAPQTFTVLAAPIPVLTSLQPTEKNVGDVFTLVAFGSAFSVGAVIVWNGGARPTTRVSATELTTQINLGGAVAGTVQVLVRNPTGIASAPQPFVIHPAVIPNQKIPVIVIDGVVSGAGQSRRVLLASLTIQDQLNEVPNTCTFTVQGARPMEGADLVIAYGSASSPSRLFAGTVLRVTQIYVVQDPGNVLWQVEGIDYTWELNRRLVVAKYTNQSASAIAANLVATWAPAGFTTAIETGLPVLDEISFTNTPLMDAFAQLATRIGGYASCDYTKAIGLWITPTGTAPTPLTASHPSLQEFQVTRDLSQVVTRALVEGGGVTAITLVPPGETRLPVDDTTWYSAGLVASGPQRVKYTDVVAGNTGAIIGPGVAPVAAPGAACIAGGTLPNGTYKYGYTWVTAAGETLVSPLGATKTGVIPGPPYPPIPYHQTGGSIPGGYTYTVGYCYSTDASGATPPRDHTDIYGSGVTLGAAQNAINATNLYYSGDTRVKAILVVRTMPARGDGNYYFTGEFAPNDPSKAGQTVDLLMTRGDAAFPQTAPNQPDGGANTTGGQQITLTGIALGPGGVTARKIYRTAVNGSAVKLLRTIADNTATTLATDTAADASLGAAPPTTDTSGLTSTAQGGQILPGATAILVSSIGPFGTAGWARVADQVIRYTGASGKTLTGIPATGPGSLTAAVSYGTSILVAPQLIGIPATGTGAIRYPILPGDEVNLLVIVDDLAAQASLAALLGGDGVVEEYQQDRRITHTEAQARADALLELKSTALETYRYRSRDPLTRSGTTIAVDLPPPTDVHGTYEIQDVTIGGFLGTDEYPFYDVTASSRRFTFEDLLRRRRAATTTG